MELLGEKVKHKVFGKGQIIEFKNDYVKVLFEERNEEKDFSYPSVFGGFLELENKSLLGQVQEVLSDIAHREAEERIMNEVRIKSEADIKAKAQGSRRPKTTTKKTSDTSNIALKCSYCEGTKNEDTMENKGLCRDEKGLPISLKKASPSSLALLTSKLPGDKEEKRFIFAAFLIDKKHEGGTVDEGYTGANPKYKIQLLPDEVIELRFWDYYFNPNNPEKVVFGSASHKYITDVQSAQVLKKIYEMKEGTIDEEPMQHFLEYYCTIKNLDINEIPTANGALKR
jgi:hypothetical protein